jgi:hypothetical protein
MPASVACPSCGRSVRILDRAEIVQCEGCLVELATDGVGFGDGPFRQLAPQVVELKVRGHSRVIEEEAVPGMACWRVQPPYSRAITIAIERNVLVSSEQRRPLLEVPLSQIRAIGVDRVGAELGDVIIKVTYGLVISLIQQAHLPLDDARWLAATLRKWLVPDPPKSAFPWVVHPKWLADPGDPLEMTDRCPHCEIHWR